MKPPGEIAFVVLWSNDLAAQRSFFVDVLGYEVQYQTPNAVVLAASGASIVLQKAQGEFAHLDGQTHAAYYVDSIDEWARHLHQRGAHVLAWGADIGEDHRTIVVQAPGGQSFALVGP